MAQENEQKEELTEVEVMETAKETSSQQSPASEETSEEVLGPKFEEPDFAAITDSIESDGEEILVAPETEITEESAATEEKVAPEETVVEEIQSESEVVEKPEEKKPEEEKKPAEEVAAAPEEELEPEPVKVPTIEDLEGMYKEHREKTLPQLERAFTLSDEDAAALDEQPSKVIPRLAGLMMYDTMLSTYNAVMTALPRIIGTHLEATKRADVAQTAFYDAWPDLENDKAASAVGAAIQAYRAANPRAKLETVIKNAGVMAMINLGLDPMKKAPEKKATTKRIAPAKPAAPRGQSPTPPARPGSQEVNPFDELTRLIEEEDA